MKAANCHQREKGVTLIELVITIALVGIISVVFMQYFNGPMKTLFFLDRQVQVFQDYQRVFLNIEHKLSQQDLNHINVEQKKLRFNLGQIEYQWVCDNKNHILWQEKRSDVNQPWQAAILAEKINCQFEQDSVHHTAVLHVRLSLLGQANTTVEHLYYVGQKNDD